MNKGKHTVVLAICFYTDVVNALFETCIVDEKEMEDRANRAFTMLYAIVGAVIVVGIPFLLYFCFCEGN